MHLAGPQVDLGHPPKGDGTAWPITGSGVDHIAGAALQGGHGVDLRRHAQDPSIGGSGTHVRGGHRQRQHGPGEPVTIIITTTTTTDKLQYFTISYKQI